MHRGEKDRATLSVPQKDPNKLSWELKVSAIVFKGLSFKPFLERSLSRGFYLLWSFSKVLYNSVPSKVFTLVFGQRYFFEGLLSG
jgi:hypothetical protein